MIDKNGYETDKYYELNYCNGTGNIMRYCWDDSIDIFHINLDKVTLIKAYKLSKIHGNNVFNYVNFRLLYYNNDIMVVSYNYEIDTRYDADINTYYDNIGKKIQHSTYKILLLEILLLNLQTDETKIINLHNSIEAKIQIKVYHDNLLIIYDNQIDIYNLCMCQFICNLKSKLGKYDIELYNKHIARIYKKQVVQIYTN